MRVAILIAIFLFIPLLAYAQTTWFVPDDFPTIQGAISHFLVVNGDSVIVRPGTYVENIDYLGKTITLESEQGPTVTVIDGNHAGSVVTYQSGEDADSVLDGFTIKDGSGKGDWIYGYKGGGVFCIDASPTIKNNIIDNNGDGSFGDNYGGGLYLKNSSALIQNNTISHNGMGAWDFSSYGGGISVEGGSPTIEGNVIEFNGVSGGSMEGAADGGGIFAKDSEVFITNNIIRHNSAHAETYNGASGGGVYIYNWNNLNDAMISNNIIHSNKVEGYCAYGGGIWCISKSTILNNIIYGNTVIGDPGSPWPPIFIRGGGICCRDNYLKAESHIISNTIFNNILEGYVPGRDSSGMHLDEMGKVFNSIIWGNIGSGQMEGPGTDVTYCDVEGGYPNTGNIDQDPLFIDPVNGDCHLTWISPCINRGINDDALLEDFEGDPRPYMGTADMGADEFIGTHPLEADGFVVSEGTGGTVNFYLTGGMDNNGRNYIILGGVTGTSPGTPLPGGFETLRLNWDPFTDLIFSLVTKAPLFMNFLGTLDISGIATAQLNAPPVPGFAGLTMYYAYALNNPWDFVSNPVAIEIVP